MATTYATPAAQRARDRRDQKIQSLRKAQQEIESLSQSQDWKPIELMYEVVKKTGISLATVNLAYRQYEKSQNSDAE